MSRFRNAILTFFVSAVLAFFGVVLLWRMAETISRI